MNKKQILALGFFDGVHLGHQALLRACRDLATEYSGIPGAVTFSAHPGALVKGATPPLLNSLQDRKRLLHRFGMEQVHVLPFDEEMMTMPWQAFLQMLRQQYSVGGLVCGDDFRFGHRGEGNAEKLKAQCDAWGIPCIVVKEQTFDHIRISSTYIRGLLEQGQIERATAFLGHPHLMTGTVIPGRGLGHTLGIPTANLSVPEHVQIPGHGVYICRALVGEESYAAVTNIGMRPTVGGHHMTVEPWLLNFEGNLYGQQLTLEFHCWLRSEIKFDSLDAMQAEIRKNAVQTLKYFEKS